MTDNRDRKASRSRIARFLDVIQVETQGQARQALSLSETTVAIVIRGVPRTVVFRCPCGCNDVVVLNVDRQAGAAWRLRLDSQGITLLPSVWRTGGCRSHFVVWRGGVWWCQPDDERGPGWPIEMDIELRIEWRRRRPTSER